MANQVTKDTIIIDVLKMDPGTADFFIQIGMHVWAVLLQAVRVIEQACMVHGVDCDELVGKINSYLASK